MDVSQYLEIFIDETNGHLQNLSDCIMSLEKDPENMDTINEIFRAAHSLKGMAGTMGFKRMQRLTHDMENVFQEVRSGNMNVTSGLVDVLFQCLDAIDAYLENVKESSDEGTDDNEAIIQELNDILAAGTGNAPQPAEKPAEKEEKPKEDPSGGRFQKKYHDMDLSEKEKEELRESEEKGMNLYGMTVYIQEDCLLKAARAFLVFKAVEEFGNIIVYNPSSQDIEDEKFGFDFSFYVASETELDRIIEVSKAVSEIEEVVGEKVVYKELTAAAAKKEEEEAAREAEKARQEETAVVPQAQAAPQAKPPQAQANKKQNGGKPVTNRTVRVDIEKLDALMNQVSELIIAKNSLVSIGSTSDGGMGSNSQAFHEQIEYLERITTGLHESVMKVRMVPIESVVQKFPRMIRDLSKKLDKKMELYMTGEETELDRTVVDQIGDPLMHLLRNSADHGLESAEVRVQRGKPAVGSIFLDAYQEGNTVVIEVRDDGNGIDVEAVKQKAIDRGTITAEQAANMTDKEIIDLLFLPSFSTAKKVTDVSGRGVGLDVVKSMIESLSGEVEVKSKLGEGSTWTIRLPLTLAIIQALMVVVGEEKYAISLGSIQTLEDIPASDVKLVQNKEVIHLRGTVIPLIRLNEILDVERKPSDEENLIVVIVKKGDRLAGLVIDELIGQQEIVIKSLGRYIKQCKFISGATILGDGEIALILDANTLI